MLNHSLIVIYMFVKINNQHGHWFVGHIEFPASLKQGIHDEDVSLILNGYMICIFLSKQSEIDLISIIGQFSEERALAGI